MYAETVGAAIRESRICSFPMSAFYEAGIFIFSNIMQTLLKVSYSMDMGFTQVSLVKHVYAKTVGTAIRESRTSSFAIPAL